MNRTLAILPLVTLLTACAPAPVVEEMVIIDTEEPILSEAAAPVLQKSAPQARDCSVQDDDEDGITGTGCLPE